jgi:hypothetical protein
MSEHEPVEAPAALPALGAAFPNDAAASPPPGGAIDCPTCGGSLGDASPPSYVYAIGRLESRSPLLSVEKEFCPGDWTGRDRPPHRSLGASPRPQPARASLSRPTALLGHDHRGI